MLLSYLSFNYINILAEIPSLFGISDLFILTIWHKPYTYNVYIFVYITFNYLTYNLLEEKYGYVYDFNSAQHLVESRSLRRIYCIK